MRASRGPGQVLCQERSGAQAHQSRKSLQEDDRNQDKTLEENIQNQTVLEGKQDRIGKERMVRTGLLKLQSMEGFDPPPNPPVCVAPRPSLLAASTLSCFRKSSFLSFLVGLISLSPVVGHYTAWGQETSTSVSIQMPSAVWCVKPFICD